MSREVELSEDYSDHTVASVSSAAGDVFLFDFRGRLDESEIKEQVFQTNPTWWGSTDYVYVDEVIHFRWKPQLW